MSEQQNSMPETIKTGSASASMKPNGPVVSRRTWYQRFTAFLGFNKSYNVPLFLVLAGAMFAFCLSYLPSLDVPNGWAPRAAPGEWYWYKRGHYRIGITLHLCSVVPAGLLVVWQFIPAIRHRAILFHRINGYVIITLITIANVSALMIMRHAFGGDLSTQSGVCLLATMTTAGMVLAWLNIKKLQIEQHRAWMLRTWIYLGSIITTRLILIISAQIVTSVGSYHCLMTCGELFDMQDRIYVLDRYPSCAAVNTSIPTVQDTVSVPVLARFGENIEEIGASLRLPFGMALWLAVFIHVIAVEVYLSLTPREAERLRKVSYERQLEAGMKLPGSAGLVIEKFGDAECWKFAE